MAKHKVEIKLTGFFEIDDYQLSAYDANNVREAIKNQLSWLEDSGDLVSFVADTIEKPQLTLSVDGYETSSNM